MGALMDHLRGKYPSMSSSNVFRLQTNAAGTLTLILDLLSPKIDTESPKTIDANANDVQFLRDVNCGLQYLPTFQIVFTPMAIVSDQDSPPPSSRTLFNVLLVNYQGTVLKKDFMTFYVNFPEEVIEAAKAAALEEAGASADDPDVDIVVDPDVELADKTSSNCELLHKLDRYREFRLCCGVRKNRKCPQIRPGSVFVEPFGDSRSNFVVRARECIFMLELENASNINREPSTTPENCHSCQVMESKLTEVGIDRLKTLSRVKVEVKDETSGATLVLPIETVGGEVGGTELLAVVDVDQDGTVIQRQSEIIGPDDMDDDAGVGMVMDDIMEGKENASKVSVVKTGDPNNPTEFKCESCDKVFKFIDSYWKHAKKCGRESIGGGVGSKKLSAEQQQMMVTLKGEDTKNTCSNCGRDFFHEVNWRKHEEMCKIGRVKRRSIYKQEVDETGQVVKRPRPKPRPKKPKVEGGEGAEGGEVGEEESKDMKAPKEVKECLICLKKVGNQWERHIKLHKERVGDKLYEQTVCPSWDCEQIFEDRISLNKHFLENHDVEAIPCVYCVRLILKDRIQQHLRNEHPHMSHMCTECGRECIYPSALKQHIKEYHMNIRDAMCELCGKSYPNDRALRKHLKTHAIQREHVCPDCGKDFLTSTKLNEHRRVHTGAKPFQCKVCAYRAGKKENVQAHVKKVHSIQTGFADYVLVIQEELNK